MAKKAIEVVPNKTAGGWDVKQQGDPTPLKSFVTKDPAKDYGTKVAKQQQTELVIKKGDGTIQNKNSFGNDPNPPKDKKG